MFLENVFKKNGVPTVTFVEPVDFPKLVVAHRAKGRGVVVEGPSGIGKTSAVEKALEVAKVDQQFTKLSARRASDIPNIRDVAGGGNEGYFIIDDFHKLEQDIQASIADKLKVMADEETEDGKIVVIGINESGRALVKFADDVATRLDFFKLEVNPDSKIQELIAKGESELNIEIDTKNNIVEEVKGSFFLAQLLCYELCASASIIETQLKKSSPDVSFESVKGAVWKELDSVYRDACIQFARGPKFRPSGRAPYLNIFRWLGDSAEWSISLKERIRFEDELRGSVGQVLDKGFFESNLVSNDTLSKAIHYNPDGARLTIEDPKLIFYLRNIPWNSFAKEIGFRGLEFKTKYDFALSFAGSARVPAESIVNELKLREFEVFYDMHEQDRIAAADVEDYLAPIYRSESRFVVEVIDDSYPNRIWTRFEAEQFKGRFDGGDVVPVLVDDTSLGAFSGIEKIGHLHVKGDGSDAAKVADILESKIGGIAIATG